MLLVTACMLIHINRRWTCMQQPMPPSLRFLTWLAAAVLPFCSNICMCSAVLSTLLLPEHGDTCNSTCLLNCNHIHSARTACSSAYFMCMCICWQRTVVCLLRAASGVVRLVLRAALVRVHEKTGGGAAAQARQCCLPCSLTPLYPGATHRAQWQNMSYIHCWHICAIAVCGRTTRKDCYLYQVRCAGTLLLSVHMLITTSHSARPAA